MYKNGQPSAFGREPEERNLKYKSVKIQQNNVETNFKNR